MPTDPSIQPDRVFRFGPFELSERDSELRKYGVRTKLQEQPFLALVELASNAGRIVTLVDLQQKLWPADTFVDFDVGLNSVIRQLRQALGDDADNPHYIEALARQGYRFLARFLLTRQQSRSQKQRHLQQWRSCRRRVLLLRKCRPQKLRLMDRPHGGQGCDFGNWPWQELRCSR
jgi:DNA-binding winged helix-turn-helix (wHTH) protein